MVVETVVAAHAEAAPAPAGAFGILHQLIAQDAHGIVDLGLLHRRVLGVLAMGLDRVRAVALRAPAIAAAERLQVAVIGPGARVPAAEPGMALHRLGARDHPLGNGLGERLEDGVGEADLRLPAGHDREGMHAVDHRALRGRQPHMAVEAFIHRQVGVGHAFERIGRGRVGLGVGRVRRRATLLVAAGEVEQHAVLVDRNPHREAHGVFGEPVIVHKALGAILAPGQLRELRGRAPVGVGDQLVHVEVHRLRAVAVEQRREPPRAGIVGGDLRAEVARGLAFGADLGKDQPEHVVHDPAGPHHLHRGDDDPFLVDLAERADARRRAAAHIHMMGEIAEITLDLAPVVEGRDHDDVVQMRAARIGVVDDQMVAGAEVLRPVFEHPLAHRAHHRAQVVGLAEGLRDGAEVPVEQAAGEVAARLDVGGIGAPPERQRHFLRGLEEAVAQDLELDGIDLHRGAPPRAVRRDYSRMRALQTGRPGGKTGAGRHEMSCDVMIRMQSAHGLRPVPT